MNTNRFAAHKALTITAAVLGIVAGALLLIDSIFALDSLVNWWEWWGSPPAWLWITVILIFISSTVLLAFGIAMCAKRDKRIVVGGLAASAVILVNYIAMFALASSYGWLINVLAILVFILVVATLAFMIVALCVPYREATPQQVMPVQKQNESTNKIELLKKLRYEGQITDEEFKDLLMKELEK